MPEGIKRRRGKNVLAIDLLFLMVITICASLLQYGAENHLLNYEPFWKIQLFYSGYWAAVSLCSPFKTPSPLAIKERKSFPGHSSVLQHYSREEKKCLYCSPVSTAFLPNCFGHIFWWRAAKAYCPKRMRTLNLEYLRCKYWSGLICHHHCKDYSTTSAIMIISLCAVYPKTALSRWK